MTSHSTKPLVIGLTGGVASGKSEAASHLESLGAAIIDADQIARQVVELPEIHQELKAAWPQVFDSDRLDRKKLRQIVFASKEAREKLNKILHPIIIRRVLEQIGGCNQEVCVLVAPLLIEVGLHQMVDEIWAIQSTKEQQLKRLEKRDGISHEEALAMIESQLSQEEKLAHSDYVFDNSGSPDGLKAQIKKEWLRLVSRKDTHSP